MAVDHSPRAFAVTVAVALGLSYGLRFWLVEPQAMGALCTPAAAPWWCALRQGIILGFYHGVFAWTGVALLLAALARPGRPALYCVLAAAACGSLALVFYREAFGAMVLLAAALRALALASLSPPTSHGYPSAS